MIIPETPASLTGTVGTPVCEILIGLVPSPPEQVGLYTGGGASPLAVADQAAESVSENFKSFKTELVLLQNIALEGSFQKTSFFLFWDSVVQQSHLPLVCNWLETLGCGVCVCMFFPMSLKSYKTMGEK